LGTNAKDAMVNKKDELLPTDDDKSLTTKVDKVKDLGANAKDALMNKKEELFPAKSEMSDDSADMDNDNQSDNLENEHKSLTTKVIDKAKDLGLYTKDVIVNTAVSTKEKLFPPKAEKSDDENLDNVEEADDDKSEDNLDTEKKSLTTKVIGKAKDLGNYTKDTVLPKVVDKAKDLGVYTVEKAKDLGVYTVDKAKDALVSTKEKLFPTTEKFDDVNLDNANKSLTTKVLDKAKDLGILSHTEQDKLLHSTEAQKSCITRDNAEDAQIFLDQVTTKSTEAQKSDTMDQPTTKEL